jgi:hypothetical protein
MAVPNLRSLATATGAVLPLATCNECAASSPPE